MKSLTIAAVLVWLVAGVLAIQPVSVATADVPYELYYIPSQNLVCVDFGEWGFCMCEGECKDGEVPCTTPTDEPSITPTTPTEENTPTPTDVPPTPTDTPEPTPTDKPKCNRGIGNLDEGCDPGNSSGQGQGGGRRAGEDRDEPVGPHK